MWLPLFPKTCLESFVPSLYSCLELWVAFVYMIKWTIHSLSVNLQYEENNKQWMVDMVKGSSDSLPQVVRFASILTWKVYIFFECHYSKNMLQESLIWLPLLLLGIGGIICLDDQVNYKYSLSVNLHDQLNLTFVEWKHIQSKELICGWMPHIL